MKGYRTYKLTLTNDRVSIRYVFEAPHDHGARAEAKLITRGFLSTGLEGLRMTIYDPEKARFLD